MIQNACAIALVGIVACFFLLPKAIHMLIAGAQMMGAN